MPPQSQEGRRWPAPLGSRVASDANVAEVAEAVLAVWHEIDQALSPIIGQRGVAALYNRSLKLASASHPWLASGHSGVFGAIDPSALKSALMQQTAAQAGDGGCALFETFRELLASLVGASLAERLLRSVWTLSSGASPAQDHSS
jgi:hypothetical protein